jgi:hypothetical protein
MFEENSKNIFVVFAPGTGGNHLANLLSTDPRFPRRAGLESYESNNQANAHVDGIENLGLEYMNKVVDYRKNVFCGHWGEMYWLKLSGLLDRFTKRQIILIKIPNENTIAYHRFQKLNGLSKYFIEEQRSIYSIEIIQKTLDESDFHVIDCDMIFSNSIAPLLEFTKKEMDLNLDSKLCSKIHRIWFDKISAYLAR